MWLQLAVIVIINAMMMVEIVFEEAHNVEDMLVVEKDIEEDMRVVEDVGFHEDSYLDRVHED